MINRPTRRGFVALLGSVGIAGCIDLPFIGDQSVTLDGEAISAVTHGESVSVSKPLPVKIEQSYLTTQEQRVRKLLTGVPKRFSPEEIPNGVVRQDLNHQRIEAKRTLSDSTNTDSDFRTLEELRLAREYAASVAATWKAINGRLNHDTVAQRTETIRNQLNEFHDKQEYVGNDPVTAVLVHASVDEWLITAYDSFEAHDTPYKQLPSFEIGELVGREELVRAAIDQSGYLYNRFTEMLVQQRDLRPRFEQTAAELQTRIKSRRKELPDIGSDPGALVDQDVSGTPATELLEHLYYEATRVSSGSERKQSGGTAKRILEQQRQLTYLRALETARTRIEDGETFSIESADGVKQLRSQAITSIEQANNSAQYPQLGQYTLAPLDRFIETSDNQFRGSLGTVKVENIAHYTSIYPRTTLIAESVPAASTTVGDLLIKR